MLDLAAFDSLTNLIVVVDAKDRIEFVNTALESLAGQSRKQLRGKSIGNLLDGVAPEHFKMESILRMNTALKLVLGAEVAVQAVISPLPQKRALIELSILDQNPSNQQEVNKELLRNLAHEIKNPLGGIRGAAQLLQMDLADKSLIEYTQVIIHEADRLQSLVDRLLAPHRQPHVVGQVNVHEICERVRQLILVEFPQGLTVVRDYDASIPEFKGDRAQLIQAILNIAHNAAQALEEQIAEGKAQLTFKTRVARQALIGKHRHKLALQLHIMDNGPGVPEDIKERIFYPLVSGRAGGSGLGLSLAQNFVEQHGGEIDCESIPGRTDFCIVIPLHRTT